MNKIKNNYIIKIMPHYLPITKQQHISIWNVAQTFMRYSKFATNFLVIGVNNNNHANFSDNITILTPYANKTKKDMVHSANNYLNNNISRTEYIKFLLEKIKTFNPKLIEVENDHRLAGIIAKKTRIPVILIAHVIIAKKNFLSRIIQYINYIRYIQEIIFVSNVHKNHFKKNFFYSKKPCTVIHNSYAHITPTKKHFFEKNNQIIFVGRGTVDKGYQEYILGVLQILKSYPNWNAIACLSVNNLKTDNQVDNFLKAPNIQLFIKNKKLKIFKNTPNKTIFKYFETSKIAVSATHSSFIEGLPLVGIEAFAAKCAFITSRNPGFLELCKNNALYLDSINPNDIAQKIYYFINNPEKMEYYALSGYNYLLHNFNITNLVELYDKIRSKYIK